MAQQTTYTVSQWAAIQQAVNKSLAGIQGGETVQQIASGFEASLFATPGTNPNGAIVTAVQANALTQAYENVIQAPGGNLGFREQGSSAIPFATAWESRLHELFGTVPNPVTPTKAPAPATVVPKPVAVAPVNPTPAAPAPPAPSSPVTIAPPPSAIAPPASSSAADPSGANQVAALVASLQAATAAATAATAAASAAPANTGATSASPASAATSGTGASTAAGTTDSTLPADFASALLGAAQNANVAGSGSVAGGVGYADTSGATPIQTTPTTTTGPDTALILGVVGLVAIGGVFWYLHHRQHAQKAGNGP